MENVIITLLKCTISMSVITLLYATALPYLSKRYAAKWRYIVWLVITAGWLVPFRPLIELPVLPAQNSTTPLILLPISPTSPATDHSVNVLRSPQGSLTSRTQISFWTIVCLLWILGVIIMLVYQILRHLRFMKIVSRWSKPVTTPDLLHLVDRYQQEQGIQSNIKLKTCASIASPMLVGLFHPVILIPSVLLSESEVSLIIKHELIHFKRHDLWYKVMILATTILHWFNPVVHFMARAISVQCEFSCDELVLQHADMQTRKQYGETIIAMVRNGIVHQTTLSTNFYGGKQSMKKRIASMLDSKRKKASISVLCIVLAAILLTGATLVSARMQPSNSISNSTTTTDSISNVAFTEKEYSQLLALQFDGYEDMTVAEFQQKVWEATDTLEYLELLDRFYQDESMEQMRDTNETAGFLHYILGPLTGQRWELRNFGSMHLSDSGRDFEKAMLEYDMEFRILDANSVKVRDYDNARRRIRADMEGLITEKTDEILQDEQSMREILKNNVKELENQWSTDALQIQISYSFLPLSIDQAEQANLIEEWNDPYGTEEDYRSLLTLKTNDYQKQSVADFNAVLLDWANEDYDRMERIGIDTSKMNFPITLVPEEFSFIELTINYSGLENAALIKSYHTGEPKEDVLFSYSLPEKKAEQERRYSMLYYQGSYHISDDAALTVGERDRCIGGVISGIQKFWEDTSLEELQSMDETDVHAILASIAAQYSNDLITITILPDQVYLEQLDDGSYAN